MEKEKCRVLDWRIENLSHWCAEVHGECIKSPNFFFPGYDANMELYPKGTSGKDEHLVVRFTGSQTSFSGDLSFYSSDGGLLCSKQPVNAKWSETLKPLPGPKFEDVLSRIREESQDFITVRFRIKDSLCYEQRVCTSINVTKISMQINPRYFKNMKSNETKEIFFILCKLSGMYLRSLALKNKVSFLIQPPNEDENPFAVEMSVSLTRSDGTVDSCVKKEHFFRGYNPWTFPDSLEKKDLVGKGISLFLCLKTREKIQSPSYVNWDSSDITIDPIINTLRSPTNSILSNQSKDSVAMLTKDFMCLFRDQDFTDLQLKCDNVSFPVHKAILSARSPVFKTMFSTDMKESVTNEVDVGDLDPSTLALFLAYLYTGAVEDLQCDGALKLYYAADKYQVPTLRKVCADFLGDHVSISNVCDILTIGDKHQDDQLMSVAHDFILENYNDVLKSKEWESLMKNEPFLAAKTVTHFAQSEHIGKIN